MKKERMKVFSERYHGQIHFLFGVFAWILGMRFFQGEQVGLFLIAIAGAYVPDIDHLLFIYGYGRKTQFSKEARISLINGGVSSFIGYMKKNHKGNTRIVSHNLLSLGLVMAFSWWSIRVGHSGWGVFFISWSLHYIFDILEDLLFFGKLNGNWCLSFGK